jgi:AcrR family transcriptional regulator
MGMAYGPSDPPEPAESARDRKKDEVRSRILDAWIELMVEGSAELTHDEAARRAGVARRTAYRYFPDRAAMMQAALLRVRELAGPHVVLPSTMEELIATLEPIYTGFDRIAPIVVMTRSTPQGRALRLSQNGPRVKAYTKAAAEAVKDLPPRDRKLATAMLQLLHTTPWLEMRDTWGLDGHDIARAARWAVRALLADLKARGERPLDEELPLRGAEPLRRQRP